MLERQSKLPRRKVWLDQADACNRNKNTQEKQH
jgi:hypothetical protein